VRATVAVVDDDAGVRRALHRLIDAAGFDVVSFPDAASYLASSERAGVDCLVVDIRMPVMDGFELLRLLSGDERRRVPVVFVTGHGDERLRTEALRAGAVEVLFKPIDDAELIAEIERAIASRQSSASPAARR
jgi:FixJ family two-component response regulator